LFPLSRKRTISKAVVVLPLEVDEMIREALDSLAGFGGELMGSRIVNPSRCSHNLVSAA
jgi:hypothetical protein